MTTAIKQRVTVGPGGTIQLQSNQLQAGEEVEVTVTADVSQTAESSDPARPVDKPKLSLADYIGSVSPSFKSVEEVDAYIRELRDEWD